MTTEKTSPKIRKTKKTIPLHDSISAQELAREQQFESKINDSSAFPFAEEITHISIQGAREHNLKNVSTTIPRDNLVVITGLSGSGKSSLAFDTLYAEGQRRYVECLSPYARQFLGMMKKPDVDIVEGVSPAISIEQKSVSQSPRSTVGTVTEVYDYLRLLYAKIGIQYCVNCDIPVQSQSLDQIVDTIIGYGENTRLQLLSPLVRGRKGHYRELFETLLKQGYTRVRVDGEVQEITAGLMLDRYKVHNIELVVDRLIVDGEQRSRISQSVELALKMGEDRVVALRESGEEWIEQLFSTSYSCPSCNESYQPLAPNMFSFNSPFGACDVCQGLGEMRDFDMDRVVPDENISLSGGAITLLGKERDTWLWQQIRALCQQEGIDSTLPFSSLTQEQKNILYYGGKRVKVNVAIRDDLGVNYNVNAKFPGILNTFRHQYTSTSSSKIRDWLETFMGEVVCPECNGGRLKQPSLFVRVHGRGIAEATNADIPDAMASFTKLRNELTEREYKIANLIVKEIISRLSFLHNVGLSYLSLNRSARTLSGGESQRIRLASQIGSQLVGVMYVLDEPSIGLHQHDNSKLIHSLKQLRDLGNTIIVVEHDREMIEEADYLIDIGPGAGVHGGHIVVEGKPKELLKVETSSQHDSLTAKYLTQKADIELPASLRKGNGKFIELVGATGNNLNNVSLRIPLGTFTCVTGMSGSGKSSLINHTLYPILSKEFFNAEMKPLPYNEIKGLQHIDKVIEIDQSPIGRTPRSNPATYTGLFTLIRDHFTLMPEAKVRGYKAGRFSFNVAGGRCEECEGAGIKRIEMNFLPDVYVECDVCGGKRYNDETLQVTYKDKSIADVLAMTVEEAVDFFSEIPKISKKLRTLYEVGLTYITLGQQAPTLSGGEAQRVKLATELSKTSTGKTLYLLDEPTTGLHFEDIRILLKLLNKLADKGNTVVVIEHNLDVIKCADWIIDLGPEGGKNGGSIIAEGTPSDVCTVSSSYTGQYLQKEIDRTKKAVSSAHYIHHR